MGIDIYMHWNGQTEAEKEAQFTGFSVVSGHVGYLREAYHGGPYATRLLVPEAFADQDSDDGPQIPAAVMRERLTAIVEPSPTHGGHDFGAAVGAALGAMVKPDNLQSMSVEDAIRERYRAVYNTDDCEDVLKSFRDFVALAERKEAETGEPVRVEASY